MSGYTYTSHKEFLEIEKSKKNRKKRVKCIIVEEEKVNWFFGIK